MKVLALSPHTDDIELGCGGYLTKLHEQGHEINVLVYSHIYNGVDLIGEWERSMLTGGFKGEVKNYPTREFYSRRSWILQEAVEWGIPDLVLLPSSSDTHQDHRVVHEGGVRAFSKECSVLAYELPWNCRAFKPNYFVELKRKHLSGKLKLLDCFESQRKRPYFDKRFIEGWARTRGQQIKKEFAEAFEVITWID
jgi:LmbE family N-acetylglucosaminyl deacetylase